MVKRQQELDSLLLTLRGIISLSPIMYLVSLVQDLSQEEFDELNKSGKLQVAVDTIIQSTKEIDQMLKEIDIKYWGQPMGLTTILAGE